MPSAFIFSTSPDPGLLQETGLLIFKPPGTCTLLIFHYISTKFPSRYYRDCSFVLPGTLSESELYRSWGSHTFATAVRMCLCDASSVWRQTCMGMIHTILQYNPCAYIGDCARISSKPYWSALVIETGLLQEIALVLEIIRYVVLHVGL